MLLQITKQRLKIFALVVILVAVVYAIYIKPRKEKCEYQPYYAQLNDALKAQRPGASAGIIDLNNLDNNVNVVCNTLGSNFKLRLVAKSLPSLDLLRYLMKKGNTNRLMVFSEPYIADVLNESMPIRLIYCWANHYLLMLLSGSRNTKDGAM